ALLIQAACAELQKLACSRRLKAEWDTGTRWVTGRVAAAFARASAASLPRMPACPGHQRNSTGTGEPAETIRIWSNTHALDRVGSVGHEARAATLRLSRQTWIAECESRFAAAVSAAATPRASASGTSTASPREIEARRTSVLP